jgi:hypothetical protein
VVLQLTTPHRKNLTLLLIKHKGLETGLNLRYNVSNRKIYNIKMDFMWDGGEGMDLIDLAQDRERWRAVVNAIMNLRVP